MRNRCVGFVFQRHHLVPALTALENVAVPLRYRGLSRSEALDRAARWLERVGLGRAATTSPASFPAASSSGWPWPGLWPASRPCSSRMSPRESWTLAAPARLVELLQELNRELGQTVVVATHDPAVAAACRRVVEMRDGRLM